MRIYMLYKLHYGHVAADELPQLILMCRTSRHLNSNAYKVPYLRTNYHMNSFFPRTRREWNSLPKDITTLPNLDSFYKKHFLHDRNHFVLINKLMFIFFNVFIYLFTFLRPTQESSFLKEVGPMKEEEEGSQWSGHLSNLKDSL